MYVTIIGFLRTLLSPDQQRLADLYGVWPLSYGTDYEESSVRAHADRSNVLRMEGFYQLMQPPVYVYDGCA